MFDKGFGGFMEAVNPQKIKLLKLYEILRQHTDEDRPLSTNQLCAMLEAEGITCDRRTLAEDIDILNDLPPFYGPGAMLVNSKF